MPRQRPFRRSGLGQAHLINNVETLALVPDSPARAGLTRWAKSKGKVFASR
jgi:hypothetical protein